MSTTRPAKWARPVFAAALLLLITGSGVIAPHHQALAAHHIVYVALGGSHTFGTGADNPTTDSYPAVLAHYLPQNATFLNVAQPNTGAAAAVTSELPRALAAHPTLVTVWLGFTELARGVDPAVFGRALDQIVGSLSRAHARIFIGNIPDPLAIPNGLVNQPRYVGIASAYNATITRLARHYGAIVVDIHGATRSLWDNPDYVSRGGLIPATNGVFLTTRGYSALATLFYQTLHRNKAL